MLIHRLPDDETINRPASGGKRRKSEYPLTDFTNNSEGMRMSFSSLQCKKKAGGVMCIGNEKGGEHPPISPVVLAAGVNRVRKVAGLDAVFFGPDHWPLVRVRVRWDVVWSSVRCDSSEKRTHKCLSVPDDRQASTRGGGGYKKRRGHQ